MNEATSSLTRAESQPGYDRRSLLVVDRLLAACVSAFIRPFFAVVHGQSNSLKKMKLKVHFFRPVLPLHFQA